jgi:hypothetical protein
MMGMGGPFEIAPEADADWRAFLKPRVAGKRPLAGWLAMTDWRQRSLASI